MSPGETDPVTLLASMAAHLHEEPFVFACVPEAAAGVLPDAAIATFREPEGVTMILPREVAEIRGLDWTYPCRMITLRVHSDLSAVGFLAVITTRLAEAGISVNPVSAYHHDHLFVPENRAEDAMRVLRLIERSR